MAREVLVPVLLDELEELEVILHLALDEGFDADWLVNMMFGECVCSCQCHSLPISSRVTYSAIP